MSSRNRDIAQGKPAVVVGTDGSPTARAAVRRAGYLARSRGAALHVVTAYSGVETWQQKRDRVGAPADMAGRCSPRGDAEATAAYDAEVVEDLGITVVCQAHQGSPAKVLRDVARAEDAVLVVVGDRPSPFGFSLASRLRMSAPCAVEVFHTAPWAEGRPLREVPDEHGRVPAPLPVRPAPAAGPFALAR